MAKTKKLAKKLLKVFTTATKRSLKKRPRRRNTTVKGKDAARAVSAIRNKKTRKLHRKRMNKYRKFVKDQMPDAPGDTPQKKMKAVGRMWTAEKRRRA